MVFILKDALKNSADTVGILLGEDCYLRISGPILL